MLTTLKNKNHTDEAKEKTGWRKPLLRRKRDSLERLYKKQIQYKALRRGKKFALRKDTRAAKERMQSKVITRKAGVGLNRDMGGG